MNSPVRVKTCCLGDGEVPRRARAAARRAGAGLIYTHARVTHCQAAEVRPSEESEKVLEHVKK